MVDIIGATSQFVQLQLSFAIHFNLFPILVYSWFISFVMCFKVLLHKFTKQ